LIDRRVRLLAMLGDDVLDLSRTAARSAVLDAGRDGGEQSGRYRAIVSVAELVRFPDLVLALTGIEHLLSDDGHLWLIEPVHHPGSSATLLASLWAMHPIIAGIHLERDVALAIRTVGLSITDLERFSMPTTVYPLRLFIQGRARRVAEQVAA
jgi:hypothetical protein